VFGKKVLAYHMSDDCKVVTLDLAFLRNRGENSLVKYAWEYVLLGRVTSGEVLIGGLG